MTPRPEMATHSRLAVAKENQQGSALVLNEAELASLGAGNEHRIERPRVDICFTFDTTGSMEDKIDGLVQSTVHLVHDLDVLGLDWRVTTVPFGDLTVPWDRIDGTCPFVATRTAAETQLRSMPRYSGGGNEGESAIEAMHVALRKSYRSGAVKILVLITDEPAHLSAQATPESVSHALRRAEAVCFVASPDLAYYRRWAADNGGRWIRIGRIMETAAVLELLRSLVRRVAQVANSVHEVGGGSVQRYRELTRGSDAPIGRAVS